MTVPHTEFFDIVDTNDQPTGQILSRNEAYAQKVRFRIVHLYLLDPSLSTVYLQQRSATKSFAPLAWSATVVGHVSAGENWLEAAKRETFEELGLDLPLTFVGAFDWFDPTPQQYFMNGVLYGVLPPNTPLTLATDEVADFKAIAIADMHQWLVPNTAQHPAFASTWQILEKHLPHLCPKATP